MLNRHRTGSFWPVRLVLAQTSFGYLDGSHTLKSTVKFHEGFKQEGRDAVTYHAQEREKEKKAVKLIHFSRIFGVLHSQGYGISESHTKMKSDNGRGNYSIIKRGV